MSDRYYKVGPAVWLEPWDDDTRYVAFYLLTCEHRTLEGLFRLPLEYAVADLRWPAKRFKRAFHELQRAGFVAYDQEQQVCLIEKALKWQAPVNGNQATAGARAVKHIPDGPLRLRWLRVVERESEHLAKALRKELPEWFTEPFAERLAEPLAQPKGDPPTPTPERTTVASTSGRNRASAKRRPRRKSGGLRG